MYLDKAGEWYLLPGLYTLKRRPEHAGSKPAYRYNAEMILAYADKFIELHNQLNQATSMMGEWHRIAASERAAQTKSKTL
jgi:hypothetical protein